MTFDPSKMDPKALMELSNIVRELPPEKLSQMQGLMHNMMAGFDVRKEMEDFERTLPPGFREKLMGLMVQQGINPFEMAGSMASQGMTGFGLNQGSGAAGAAIEPEAVADPANMNMREARLTILRAVAAGKMTPEEAEKLL